LELYIYLDLNSDLLGFRGAGSGGGWVQNVRRRGGGGGFCCAVARDDDGLIFGCVLGVQNRKRVLNTETTAQTLRQPFEAFELAASDFREKIV
jgi:hypothetical protein